MLTTLFPGIRDEQITLEQAFEFGKEFAEKWFSGFQTLVAVHKDKSIFTAIWLPIQ